MKLVYPKFEIIEQKPGLEGIYEQIELAGKVCYKSEIEGGTAAKEFVDKLINRKHLSVLEHGTIYLKAQTSIIEKGKYGALEKYHYNRFSRTNIIDNITYVTTNLRVIHENNWYEDLQYLCESTEHHKKRVCVKINCGIDISRELNRQRCLSVSEQSTRYCNFSKDRFGNEITCVIPKCFSSHGELLYEIASTFREALENSEKYYFQLLDFGLRPEHARKVLPLDLATEVVYTAFTDDWEYVFSLRCSDSKMGRPHPDCADIMDKIREECLKRNLI